MRRRIDLAIGSVSWGTHSRGDGRGVARPGGKTDATPWGDSVSVRRRRPASGGNAGRRRRTTDGGLMGAAHTSSRSAFWGASTSWPATSPIRIGGRHAQALIALLALRPRPRLRDTLAAELWPEAGVPRPRRRCARPSGSSGRAFRRPASTPTPGSRPTRTRSGSTATRWSSSTSTGSSGSLTSDDPEDHERARPDPQRRPARGSRPRVLRGRPRAPVGSATRTCSPPSPRTGSTAATPSGPAAPRASC